MIPLAFISTLLLAGTTTGDLDSSPAVECASVLFALLPITPPAAADAAADADAEEEEEGERLLDI